MNYEFAVWRSKKTVFFLQTADIWYNTSATDVCRCGPQTVDVFPQKKTNNTLGCMLMIVIMSS
ncbi:hypothetical protein Hanom_Chr02g00170711 [Helianthus anomalus]